MTRWTVIENIVTMLVTGFTLVGLYNFGAEGHSFWALLILLNLNYPKAAP